MPRILGLVMPGLRLRVAVAAVVAGSALLRLTVAADEAADAHFLDHVRPLLDSRCFSCHGPDKAKGSLRLDSRAAVLKGGDLGPSAVPGQPGESLLLTAVLHAKPDLEMPPKDKLSAVEVKILERWIRDGLPWPAPRPAHESSSADTNTVERLGDAWTDPRNPIRRIFHGQRLDLWSLQPIRSPALPALPGPPARDLRNGIDHFVRATLAGAGLEPGPEADRRTLARRLYFDLTGLPPSPEELEAHLRDESPDAYERLVDRLLDSPRYGEHQARLWLDVVRYSDSNGFDWDEFRPQAWRYRDYVIAAFNADKPFDEFVHEQLAGDELLPGPPRTPAEQERLVATGYLRVGPQDNSAPLFDEQSRARAEWMADVTETTGSAFLGITLSCCRCHDHKFDPFSQADHFRFRSFFEPLQRGDDLALDLAPEQEAIRRQHAELEARRAPVVRERDALLDAARQRVRAQRIAQLPETERRLLAQTSDPQPQNFKEQAEAVAKKVAVSDDDARKALLPDEAKRHAALVQEAEELNRARRPFSRGLLATDTTNAVPATRIHFQGDHQSEREAVQPGFLSALDPNPAPIRPAANPATTGRRLALAGWIASPDNPLTARVFVNRAWQTFFGQALVATPNDFGLAGARPSHPELLDWLASEFIRGGWSIQRLHRLIVTSGTYRQAVHGAPTTVAAARRTDPGNRLLWRQNLRRLTAEQLRDALLHAAGLLQHRGGGPPVWPELPDEILTANPAFLDDNAEKTKGWYPSPPEARSVRSIFLVQKRTVRVPFLETFDLPENSTSCPQRTLSVVAPQALSLMNGQEALHAARRLADRVARDIGGPAPEQVRRAFQLALQRSPRPDEAAACERFLARAGLPELCRSLLNLNEFAYVD